MLNETATKETPPVVRMEVLQPEISHEIQNATMDELKKWIEDGKLLPNHQIRLKNLNWLNAYDLQALRPVFEKYKETVNAKPEEPKVVAKPIVTEPVKQIVEPKAEAVAPSLPFRLYEEKLSAKTKDDEKKTHESSPPSPKTITPPVKLKETISPSKKLGNSTIKSVKSIGTFVGGCALILGIAYGGSYLWIYSLRGTPKIEESRVGELAVLEQTIYNEKVNLRLKSANSNSQIDVNAEFAKLDKKLSDQRKPIIENYRQNLISNDFSNLFYFSFAVLMIAFILFRLVFAKRQQLIGQGVRSLDGEAGLTTNRSSIVDSESSDIDEEIHRTEANQTQITIPPEIHNTKSDGASVPTTSNTVNSLDELLNSPEYQQIIEQENVKFCLMHRTTSSDFVCEACENHFCSECVTTVDSKVNCCQFCRVSCKPSESAKTKVIFVNTVVDSKKQAQNPKKEINLVVKVEEEKRTYRIGVVPAFLVSLCFSLSVAYFWVYEISPKLEPKTEEVSKNAVENQNSNSANSILNKDTNSNKKVAYDLQPKTDANTGNAVQRKCVDPESKETFDCDEETYKALFDHTAKTKSVEEAQKSVEEKTNLILSPFLPKDQKDENADENTKKLSPEAEEKNASDRSKFYQIFGVSFLLMFGGLLSTRLFFKDENKENSELD